LYACYIRDPGEASTNLTVISVYNSGSLNNTNATNRAANGCLGIDAKGAKVAVAYENATGLDLDWFQASTLSDATTNISVFGSATYAKCTVATDGVTAWVAFDKWDDSYFWNVYGAVVSQSVKTDSGRHATNSKLASRYVYDNIAGEKWFCVSYYRGTQTYHQTQIVMLEGSRYVSDNTGTAADGDGVNLRARMLPGMAAMTADSLHYLPNISQQEEYDGVNLSPVRKFVVGLQWQGVLKTSVEGVRETTMNAANQAKKHGVIFRFFPDEQQQAVASSLDTDAAMYTPGGFLHSYDGNGVQEAGFFTFPQWSNTEATRASGYGGTTEVWIKPVSSAGGVLTGGTGTAYSYRVHWEWINDAGQIEQSTAITFTGAVLGASDNAYELNVPTNPYTNKVSWLAVYRAGPDPLPNDPFSRVSASHAEGSTGTYVENDPALNYVTWTDTGWNEAASANNEPNYLNTGEIDNVPAPDVPRVMAKGQNRLFFIPALNSNYVYFSKLRFWGELYAFNEDLYIPIPETGGKLTGLIATEGALVVFRERSIYLIAGTGPDNLSNGFYGQPQQISNGVGLRDHRAVKRMPDGSIIFLAWNGWHKLDQAYQLTKLSESEEWRTRDVVRCQLLPQTDLLYIACNGSNGFIYDYNQNKWSEWTTLDCYDLVSTQVSAEFATTDEPLLMQLYYTGSIFSLVEHRAGAWTDSAKDDWGFAGDDYGMYVDTGWIDLDEGQGDVGVQWWQLKGEFRGDMDIDLRIRVAYNNVDTWVDDYNPITLTEAAYGDGKPFTVKRRFSNRKLRTVRFLIEDIKSAAQADSERCALVSVALRLGRKNLIHRHNL
jgi:hypothetical protein